MKNTIGMGMKEALCSHCQRDCKEQTVKVETVKSLTTGTCENFDATEPSIAELILKYKIKSK